MYHQYKKKVSVRYLIFVKEVLFIYLTDFLRRYLYQYKATSQTSKRTTAFLEKMKIDTITEFFVYRILTSFEHTPAKFLDISSLNYCVFGLLTP